MMALECSYGTNGSSAYDKPLCLVWGCQLNRENPTYTFDFPEEWSSDQQIALRTICLGENAKDEFNIVEIVPQKDSKDSTPVHIATLKLSVLPMVTVSGFDLSLPVTFRLKSGSGPVYLAGQHVVVGLRYDEDDVEEESISEEEEESSSKEDSPIIPVKRAPAKRTLTGKKGQEQPVQEPQGRKTGRGRNPAAKGELRI